MSFPIELDPRGIEDEASSAPQDELLAVHLRFGLDEVAALEEEQMRQTPRPRPTSAQLVRLAGKIYDSRRGRDRIFKDQLFGEPAWDMLLALYCLPSRGLSLGVTSLAHAANVPPTTGHRWQKTLFEEGLIKRGPHVSDARQQLVALTDKGRMLMETYLGRLFYCEGPKF